jgi:hypothetical protein
MSAQPQFIPALSPVPAHAVASNSAARADRQELQALALDTIRQILTDPEASPSVRLKAALAVLKEPFAAPLSPEPPPEPEAAATSPQPESPAALPEIARNAPCPCGSGEKYKRCCGTQAPPQLGAPRISASAAMPLHAPFIANRTTHT